MKGIFETIKRHGVLFLVLAIMSIFRLYLFISKYHIVSWDESVFLGMGKWVASFGKLGIWESIRPPGLPIVLSPFSFFDNYVLFSDIVMFLIAIGIIVFTYMISLELFSKRVASYSVLFLVFVPIFTQFSYWIMTGLPSLLFCLIALYLFIRKQYSWSSIVCFVAFFFRYPAALILVSLNLILFYSEFQKKNKNLFDIIKKRVKILLKLNVPFLICLILFLVMNKIFYGDFLAALLMASEHQSTFVGNVGGLMRLFYYPMILLTSSFLLLLSFFSVHNTRYKKQYCVVIPFLIFLLYFTTIPHKKERFALLFLPYVAILAGIGGSFLVKQLKGVFRIVFYVVIGLSLLVSGFHIYSDTEMLVDSKPEFVDDYFEFFDQTGCDVLTSDPLVVPYSECKFYHFYDGVEIGYEQVSNYIDSADYVVYDKGAFPWNDTESIEVIERIEKKIFDDSELVLNYSYWGQNKLIYRMK